MANEKCLAGGGGDELSELENLLEELIEFGEETDRKVRMTKDDKAKAMEMKKRAVETMEETRKSRRIQEKRRGGLPVKQLEVCQSSN